VIRSRVIVCSAVAAAAALAVPAFADKPGDNDTTKTSHGTTTFDCDGGTVSLEGPQTLWPPNHKMVDQLAVAQSDDEGEAVSLTLTPALEDALGGDGGEQHDPDWSGELTGAGQGRAEVPFAVRAERSGKGTGRTYVIDWTATFGDDTCSSADDGQAPFEIFVPHDQGQGKANGRQ
jgi:hypothetical protein